MNEMTPDRMRERLGNIDQIRDILFGDSTREYDRRFQHIESELAALRHDLTEQVDRLRTVFVSDLRMAIDAIEKKIQYVNASLDEETEDLRNQLGTVESRVSGNLNIAEKRLKSQVNTLQDELNETRDRLDEELQGLRGRIFGELERRSQQLDGDKLSRADLAEILFDVCMQVKGGDRGASRSGNPDSSSPERLILPERPQDNSEPTYRSESVPDSGGDAIE